MPEFVFFIVMNKYQKVKNKFTSNSEVPKSSRVSDWMRETWTPMSLWIPLHSMQSNTPRFVESQVGSKKRLNCKAVSWKQEIGDLPVLSQSQQMSFPGSLRTSSMIERVNSFNPVLCSVPPLPDDASPKTRLSASSLLLLNTDTQLKTRKINLQVVWQFQNYQHNIISLFALKLLPIQVG